LRRRLVSWGLAVASLLLLAWLVRGHLDELGRLADVPLSAVVAVAGLFLVGRVLGGLLMRAGLAALDHRVGAGLCVMLTVLASYTNLVVPRGGLAPGAAYLRLRHDVPVTRYLSVGVVSLLLTSFLVALAGMVLQLAGAGQGALRPEVLGLFAAVALLAVLGVLAPAPLFRVLPERLRRLLAEAHAAWGALMRSPGALLRMASLQVAALLLRAVRTWIALQAAGADVGPGEALVVSVCADLGMLVSLTPAALGFREGGVLLGAALAGVAPGAAVLAAVIDRLACTVTTIVAGQIVVWRGLSDLSS